MPKHKVGDHVLVKLSGGSIVEATIKAIVDTTEGIRLQVDFGYDETALISDGRLSRTFSKQKKAAPVQAVGLFLF